MFYLQEESALTGESLPIHKSAGDLAYMSTMITSGHGEGIVIAIGTDTEIGRIASMIARKRPVPTPLQVRLGKLGKMLSFLAVLICVVLFLAALLSGGDPAEMLITSVSLAVAAVPERPPLRRHDRTRYRRRTPGSRWHNHPQAACRRDAWLRGCRLFR